jgi:hypothetical protein
MEENDLVLFNVIINMFNRLEFHAVKESCSHTVTVLEALRLSFDGRNLKIIK